MRYPTNLWSHLSLHPSLLRERQGQAWDPRAATLPSGVIQGHLYSDSKTLSEGYYLITSQHCTSDSCTGAGPFCSSPKRHVLSLIFSLSYSSLSAMPPHFFILLPKPFTNSPWSVLWLLHPTSESGSVVSDSLWPMDCTVHEILQARLWEWVAMPSSRGSSQPRGQTQVSRIVAEPLGNAL